MLAVLGHQNESEQIVTPVRSQNFKTLQHPNRAFPDNGSLLNSDQFAVLHNIVSVVVGILGHTVQRVEILALQAVTHRH